jgi:hypothetical protein
MIGAPYQWIRSWPLIGYARPGESADISGDTLPQVPILEFTFGHFFADSVLENALVS